MILVTILRLYQSSFQEELNKDIKNVEVLNMLRIFTLLDNSLLLEK